MPFVFSDWEESVVSTINRNFSYVCFRYHNKADCDYIQQLSKKLFAICNMKEVQNKTKELFNQFKVNNITVRFMAQNEDIGGVGFYNHHEKSICLSHVWEKFNLHVNYTMLDTRSIYYGKGKVKTLLHEFSHMALNTEDEAYGMKDCMDLAVKNPDKALINADSWGYFLESLYRFFLNGEKIALFSANR